MIDRAYQQAVKVISRYLEEKFPENSSQWHTKEAGELIKRLANNQPSLLICTQDELKVE